MRTLATDPLQELIVSLRRKERFDRFPAADSEKRIHRDHLLLLLALATGNLGTGRLGFYFFGSR